MDDTTDKVNFHIKEWAANELIYDYDTAGFNAFLLVKGSVEIFSPKGLKLNTIGINEIFGESSLLLDKRRSVAAKAGSNGATTQLIPKDYLVQLQNESPLLSAILRKVQLRLEDSNNQSAEYAKQIEVILKLVRGLAGNNSSVAEKLERIKTQISESFRSD
ncbi:MAG: cyclic nucleotide-binding domain-containing protein [Candidatus Puniceispirillaceae bacterium]